MSAPEAPAGAGADKLRVVHGDAACTVRLLPGVTAGQVADEAVRLFGLPDGPTLGAGSRRRGRYVLQTPDGAVLPPARQLYRMPGSPSVVHLAVVDLAAAPLPSAGSGGSTGSAGGGGRAAAPSLSRHGSVASLTSSVGGAPAAQSAPQLGGGDAAARTAPALSRAPILSGFAVTHSGASTLARSATATAASPFRTTSSLQRQRSAQAVSQQRALPLSPADVIRGLTLARAHSDAAATAPVGALMVAAAATSASTPPGAASPVDPVLLSRAALTGDALWRELVSPSSQAPSPSQQLLTVWRRFAAVSLACVASQPAALPRPTRHLPCVPLPLAAALLEEAWAETQPLADAAGVRALRRLPLQPASTMFGDASGEAALAPLLPRGAVSQQALVESLLSAPSLLLLPSTTAPSAPAAAAAAAGAPWCSLEAVVHAVADVAATAHSTLLRFALTRCSDAASARRAERRCAAIAPAAARSLLRAFGRACGRFAVASLTGVPRPLADEAATGLSLLDDATTHAPLHAALSRWLNVPPASPASPSAPLALSSDDFTIVSDVVRGGVLDAGGFLPPLAAVGAAYAHAPSGGGGGGSDGLLAPAPEPPTLSFHRVMTAAADLGLVASLGIPLHAWAAAFLTATAATAEAAAAAADSSGDSGAVVRPPAAVGAGAPLPPSLLTLLQRARIDAGAGFTHVLCLAVAARSRALVTGAIEAAASASVPQGPPDLPRRLLRSQPAVSAAVTAVVGATGPAPVLLWLQATALPTAFASADAPLSPAAVLTAAVAVAAARAAVHTVAGSLQRSRVDALAQSRSDEAAVPLQPADASSRWPAREPLLSGGRDFTARYVGLRQAAEADGSGGGAAAALAPPDVLDAALAALRASLASPEVAAALAAPAGSSAPSSPAHRSTARRPSIDSLASSPLDDAAGGSGVGTLSGLLQPSDSDDTDADTAGGDSSVAPGRPYLASSGSSATTVDFTAGGANGTPRALLPPPTSMSSMALPSFRPLPPAPPAATRPAPSPPLQRQGSSLFSRLGRMGSSGSLTEWLGQSRSATAPGSLNSPGGASGGFAGSASMPSSSPVGPLSPTSAASGARPPLSPGGGGLPVSTPPKLTAAVSRRSLPAAGAAEPTSAQSPAQSEAEVAAAALVLPPLTGVVGLVAPRVRLLPGASIDSLMAANDATASTVAAVRKALGLSSAARRALTGERATGADALALFTDALGADVGIQTRAAAAAAGFKRPRPALLTEVAAAAGGALPRGSGAVQLQQALRPVPGLLPDDVAAELAFELGMGPPQDDEEDEDGSELAPGFAAGAGDGPAATRPRGSGRPGSPSGRTGGVTMVRHRSDLLGEDVDLEQEIDLLQQLGGGGGATAAASNAVAGGGGGDTPRPDGGVPLPSPASSVAARAAAVGAAAALSDSSLLGARGAGSGGGGSGGNPIAASAATLSAASFTNAAGSRMVSPLPLLVTPLVTSASDTATRGYATAAAAQRALLAAAAAAGAAPSSSPHSSSQGGRRGSGSVSTPRGAGSVSSRLGLAAPLPAAGSAADGAAAAALSARSSSTAGDAGATAPQTRSLTVAVTGVDALSASSGPGPSSAVSGPAVAPGARKLRKPPTVVGWLSPQSALGRIDRMLAAIADAQLQLQAAAAAAYAWDAPHSAVHPPPQWPWEQAHYARQAAAQAVPGAYTDFLAFAPPAAAAAHIDGGVPTPRAAAAAAALQPLGCTPGSVPLWGTRPQPQAQPAQARRSRGAGGGEAGGAPSAQPPQLYEMVGPGRAAAARSALAWAEFHLALLCVMEGEALCEALGWADLLSAAASSSAQSAPELSPTSSSASQAGSTAATAGSAAGDGRHFFPAPAATGPPPPPVPPAHRRLLHLTRTYAQLTQRASEVTVHSYASAARDVDGVLAAACRHFERCLALRGSWPAALETLARVLTRRAMLTFPLELAAGADSAVGSAVVLPVDAPEGLLTYVSSDGSKLHSLAAATPEERLRATTLIHASAQRRAASYLHRKPAALRLLRAARTAARTAAVLSAGPGVSPAAAAVGGGAPLATDRSAGGGVGGHSSTAAAAAPSSAVCELVDAVVTLRALVVDDACLFPQTGSSGASNSAAAADVTDPRSIGGGTSAPLGASQSLRVVWEGVCVHASASVAADGAAAATAASAAAAPAASPTSSTPRGSGRGAAAEPAVTAVTAYSSRLVLPCYQPHYLAACMVPSPGAAAAAVDSGATLLAGLSPAGATAAYRLFATYDTDGDGLLAGEELAAMWADLGVWGLPLPPLFAPAALEQPSGDSATPAGSPTSGGARTPRSSQTAAALQAPQPHVSLVALSSWFAATFSCGFLAPRTDPACLVSTPTQAVPGAPVALPVPVSRMHAVTPSASLVVWESHCDTGTRCLGWLPGDLYGYKAYSAHDAHPHLTRAWLVYVGGSVPITALPRPPRRTRHPYLKTSSFEDVDGAKPAAADGAATNTSTRSGSHAPPAPAPAPAPPAADPSAPTGPLPAFLSRALLAAAATPAAGGAAPTSSPPATASPSSVVPSPLHRLRAVYAAGGGGGGVDDTVGGKPALARRLPTATHRPGSNYTAPSRGIGLPAFCEYLSWAAVQDPMVVAAALRRHGLLVTAAALPQPHRAPVVAAAPVPAVAAPKLSRAVSGSSAGGDDDGAGSVVIHDDDGDDESGNGSDSESVHTLPQVAASADPAGGGGGGDGMPSPVPSAHSGPGGSARATPARAVPPVNLTQLTLGSPAPPESPAGAAAAAPTVGPVPPTAASVLTVASVAGAWAAGLPLALSVAPPPPPPAPPAEQAATGGRRVRRTASGRRLVVAKGGATSKQLQLQRAGGSASAPSSPLQAGGAGGEAAGLTIKQPARGSNDAAQSSGGGTPSTPLRRSRSLGAAEGDTRGRSRSQSSSSSVSSTTSTATGGPSYGDDNNDRSASGSEGGADGASDSYATASTENVTVTSSDGYGDGDGASLASSGFFDSGDEDDELDSRDGYESVRSSSFGSQSDDLRRQRRRQRQDSSAFTASEAGDSGSSSSGVLARTGGAAVLQSRSGGAGGRPMRGPSLDNAHGLLLTSPPSQQQQQQLRASGSGRHARTQSNESGSTPPSSERGRAAGVHRGHRSQHHQQQQQQQQQPALVVRGKALRAKPSSHSLLQQQQPPAAAGAMQSTKPQAPQQQQQRVSPQRPRRISWTLDGSQSVSSASQPSSRGGAAAATSGQPAPAPSARSAAEPRSSPSNSVSGGGGATGAQLFRAGGGAVTAAAAAPAFTGADGSGGGGGEAGEEYYRRRHHHRHAQAYYGQQHGGGGVRGGHYRARSDTNASSSVRGGGVRGGGGGGSHALYGRGARADSVSGGSSGGRHGRSASGSGAAHFRATSSSLGYYGLLAPASYNSSRGSSGHDAAAGGGGAGGPSGLGAIGGLDAPVALVTEGDKRVLVSELLQRAGVLAAPAPAASSPPPAQHQRRSSPAATAAPLSPPPPPPPLPGFSLLSMPLPPPPALAAAPAAATQTKSPTRPPTAPPRSSRHRRSRGGTPTAAATAAAAGAGDAAVSSRELARAAAEALAALPAPVDAAFDYGDDEDEAGALAPMDPDAVSASGPSLHALGLPAQAAAAGAAAADGVAAMAPADGAPLVTVARDGTVTLNVTPAQLLPPPPAAAATAPSSASDVTGATAPSVAAGGAGAQPAPSAVASAAGKRAGAPVPSPLPTALAQAVVKITKRAGRVSGAPRQQLLALARGLMLQHAAAVRQRRLLLGGGSGGSLSGLPATAGAAWDAAPQLAAANSSGGGGGGGSGSRRLFDYFVTVGAGELDPSVDLPLTGGPLDLCFTPAVLERRPTSDDPASPLPANIALFAFPCGLRLAYGAQPPSVLHFVLTFSDGTNLHCTAAQVWEPVDALALLAHFLVPADDGVGAGAGGNGGAGAGSGGGGVRLVLPPWLDARALTAAVAAAAGGAAGANTSANNPLAGLYAPKALVLVSHHEVYGTMRTALGQLLRLSASPGLPLPVDAYVSHLLADVPLPPRGFASVGFTLGDRHLVVARPPPNELPPLDVPLAPLFQCLDLPALLAAFTALLCERRVVLCSRHLHLLTPVATALKALLFPFRWAVNYIPVLPAAAREYMGLPAPYLFGWCGSVADAQVYSAEAVFVDLDAGKVIAEEYEGAKLPPLPEAAGRELTDALRLHAYGDPAGGGGGGGGGGEGKGSGFLSSLGLGRSSTASGGVGGKGGGGGGVAATGRPLYGADHNPHLRAKLSSLELLFPPPPTPAAAAVARAVSNGGAASGQPLSAGSGVLSPLSPSSGAFPTPPLLAALQSPPTATAAASVVRPVPAQLVAASAMRPDAADAQPALPPPATGPSGHPLRTSSAASLNVVSGIDESGGGDPTPRPMAPWAAPPAATRGVIHSTSQPGNKPAGSLGAVGAATAHHYNGCIDLAALVAQLATALPPGATAGDVTAAGAAVDASGTPLPASVDGADTRLPPNAEALLHALARGWRWDDANQQAGKSIDGVKAATSGGSSSADESSDVPSGSGGAAKPAAAGSTSFIGSLGSSGRRLSMNAPPLQPASVAVSASADTPNTQPRPQLGSAMPATAVAPLVRVVTDGEDGLPTLPQPVLIDSLTGAAWAEPVVSAGAATGPASTTVAPMQQHQRKASLFTPTLPGPVGSGAFKADGAALQSGGENERDTGSSDVDGSARAPGRDAGVARPFSRGATAPAASAPLPTDPVSGLSPAFSSHEVRWAFLRFLVAVWRDYGRFVSYTQVGTQPPAAAAEHITRQIVRARNRAALLHATGGSSAVSAASFTDGAQKPSTAVLLASLGVALPPLPLPALTVSFDRAAFLRAHPHCEPLCAAMTGTQMWVSFVQSLLPLAFRFNPHTKGAGTGSGAVGAAVGYQPMDPHQPWVPSAADPHFSTRLPPSVRLFNALAAAASAASGGKSAQPSRTKSGSGTGFRSGDKSGKGGPSSVFPPDPGFLGDSSARLRVHLPVPPPLPPPVPSVDLATALRATLRYWAGFSGGSRLLSTSATAPAAGAVPAHRSQPSHARDLSASSARASLRSSRALAGTSGDLDVIAAAAAAGGGGGAGVGGGGASTLAAAVMTQSQNPGALVAMVASSSASASRRLAPPATAVGAGSGGEPGRRRHRSSSHRHDGRRERSGSSVGAGGRAAPGAVPSHHHNQQQQQQQQQQLQQPRHRHTAQQRNDDSAGRARAASSASAVSLGSRAATGTAAAVLGSHHHHHHHHHHHNHRSSRDVRPSLPQPGSLPGPLLGAAGSGGGVSQPPQGSAGGAIGGGSGGGGGLVRSATNVSLASLAASAQASASLGGSAVLSGVAPAALAAAASTGTAPPSLARTLSSLALTSSAVGTPGGLGRARGPSLWDGSALP